MAEFSKRESQIGRHDLPCAARHVALAMTVPRYQRDPSDNPQPPMIPVTSENQSSESCNDHG